MEEINDIYTNTLKTSNFHKKKPSKIIDMIFDGEDIPLRDMPSSSGAFELDGMLKTKTLNSAEKKEFVNFIKFLANKKVDVLNSGTIIKSLFLIHEYKDQWVNDIITWKKGSYNLKRQLTSIARHLFCVYSIPKFMDNIWFMNNISSRNIKIFIHLGKGGSLRTFNEINVSITKKESHYFLLAPNDFDVDEAILWSKIYALGGDERLVNAIMESLIFTNLNILLVRHVGKSKWDFWYTILRFFTEQQLLDVNLVAPLCDYIYYVKYEQRQTPKVGGGWDILPPENENFRINGRTITALIRGMEAWHKLTSKAHPGAPKKWKGIEIEDYKVIYGKEEKQKIYTFTQLLNVTSLRSEGRTHGHCVAGYANSCNSGRTSIWSMCMNDYYHNHKNLLTIEISPDHKIVQCRGKCNRQATTNEWRVVEHFAKIRDVKFSRWVSHG